jgi:hypothetical protein
MKRKSFSEYRDREKDTMETFKDLSELRGRIVRTVATYVFGQTATNLGIRRAEVDEDAIDLSTIDIGNGSSNEGFIRVNLLDDGTIAYCPSFHDESEIHGNANILTAAQGELVKLVVGYIKAASKGTGILPDTFAEGLENLRAAKAARAN